MSEMVERVAVAIAEKIGPALSGGPPVAVKDVARAAIEAMREPTEEMLKSCGNGECSKWAPGAWANMIDAALTPRETSS